VVREVIDYGVPYMRRLASLEALLEKLTTDGNSQAGPHEERRAICLYLLGRKDEARKVARAQLAREPAGVRYEDMTKIYGYVSDGLALDLPEPAIPKPGRHFVMFGRDLLRSVLVSYGEEEVAAVVAAADADARVDAGSAGARLLEKIYEKAGAIALTPGNGNLHRAGAKAAVEIIEGRPRELRRKIRRKRTAASAMEPGERK
jgi:hypothetical protein